MKAKIFDLSVVIPARNEQFLVRTVENILQNIRGNTEIIVVLDGYWDENGVPIDPRVTVIHNEEAIGQRAAINQAVRASNAKYVMKIDAHCVVDEGFDVKMMEEMHDDYTMVPRMYNLHAFDWVCEKGHRLYQGPTPKEGCKQCGGAMHKEIIFEPRWRRESEFYRFDKTLHFQYWGAFKNRPEGQPEVAPTLSLQGSCFMLTRQKFWELNICDEKHGSWGQQGTEVALKTWLSGGKVMVNKKTYYAHMFRTQGGDFGFPFPLSGSDTEKAREYSRWLFLEENWPGAKMKLEDLLQQFYPVPDWHIPVEKEKKPTKGVVYYTHHVGDPKILEETRQQIKRGMKEKHIVSVSLKPLQFGKNIVLDLQGGYLTMAKQILAGLEAVESDVVFFCEHDVLYHPKHFDFLPLRRDVVYYNTNVWRVRYEDGHALYCNNLQQLSGLCAYRDILITHYKKRVELLERKMQELQYHFSANPKKEQLVLEEFGSYVRKQGFEPGTHGRAERVDDLTSDNYQAEYPNIDIRHELNTTPSRWRKDQFVNEKYTDGWTEQSVWDLPGWDQGYLKRVFPSR